MCAQIKENPVQARYERQKIPTYFPHPAMDLPMFFEKKPYQGAAGRLYPLPFTDSLSEEKEDKEYNAVVLENEYLQVTVLPEIGGKISRGYDKIGRYDFIYHNSVIKPAMIGLAGPWASGGIEFNWPQHHRPTTFMPLEAAIEEKGNGEKIAWIGEVEPLNRMKGMAGITLCPGRSYIKAEVRLYNRTPFIQPFMWWANLAVPVNENYKIIFPPDTEWVNDHDRRAVIGWPIAKGIYQTARPYDYGTGTDLSDYNSISVNSSFMISQDQSDMDFVAGYDRKKKKGIVAFADHTVVPGKKLFHWGKGDFGNMWCSNLTDEDGPYVELMTGAYTDNQPDFTWIMPYETKTFTQYWYPVREIGDVKNVTIDGAVNMEAQGDHLLIGFHATGSFPQGRIALFNCGEPVWEEVADFDPAAPYVRRIRMEDGWSMETLKITVTDGQGKQLIAYRQPKRGERAPVTPRTPAVRPNEIETLDELFINGLHLEQYKHHTYDARDYYLEALKRDPGEIRCNTAMARLSLKDGRFEDCINYCDKAIERLVSRNMHPVDTEAFYLKGLALRYLGNIETAAELFNKVIWNYDYRSAAYYELATIDALNGEFPAALEKLELSLATNAGHLRALNLKAAILRNLGKPQEAFALSQSTSNLDKLDLWSRVEQVFAASQLGEKKLASDLQEETDRIFGCKPENDLDLVCDYLRSGFVADALAVLDFIHVEYPLAYYYQGHCRSLMGEDPSACYRKGDKCRGLCFPSRLEDIAVLSEVCKMDPQASRAHYYLGCLFYDRFCYDKAIEQWEAAIRIDPGFANAYRNLALAYFDKRHDFKGARICMEKALALKPNDPRLLYELQQLLKNSGIIPRERLALYEKYPELTERRDDCYLDKIILHTLMEDYETAIRMSLGRTFHIYEGGEGKLTRQHAWMHVLSGMQKAQAGNKEGAEKDYLDGTIIPHKYGEAKSYFAQESHIYYFLGCLYEAQDRKEDAKKAYEEASAYKAVVSELSMFRALALQKLFRFSEAQQVLKEMLDSAEQILCNTDKYMYFGVGSPTPTPFEYDIVKINKMEGYILKAYALLGLGRTLEAKQAIDLARSLDHNEFRIFTFDKIIWQV